MTAIFDDLDLLRLKAYESLSPEECAAVQQEARAIIAPLLRVRPCRDDLTLLMDSDPRQPRARLHDIVTVLLREDVSGRLVALELPEAVIGMALKAALRGMKVRVTTSLRFKGHNLTGGALAAWTARNAARDLKKKEKAQAKLLRSRSSHPIET